MNPTSCVCLPQATVTQLQVRNHIRCHFEGHLLLLIQPGLTSGLQLLVPLQQQQTVLAVQQSLPQVAMNYSAEARLVPLQAQRQLLILYTVQLACLLLLEHLRQQQHVEAAQQAEPAAPHTNLLQMRLMAAEVKAPAWQLLCQVLRQVHEQPACLQLPVQLLVQQLERAGSNQAGLPTHCLGLGWG